MGMAHTARYRHGGPRAARTPYTGATRGRKPGVPQPRETYVAVEATEEQVAYLLEHYGERLVPALAKECGLPRNAADLAVKRLRDQGLLPEGPGTNWHARTSARPKMEPSRPFCPDGSPHHRACGPLVERMIPDYYDTHARPEHGQEHQVCCKRDADGVLCGDQLTVRLWWARGEDVEVCEVA